MRKLDFIILVLIVLGAFLVRLYRFDGPIADWHSWRQADTSAVSRNFVMHGFDVLHPRFDDLSNVPSGLDNPEGYRFVEFPLYNIAQAGLYQILGWFTLEKWGRLVSIFASCVIVLFLYLIVVRHSNKTLGLLSAFFYAFIPYNIYYGRTILPDTSMVMATLGGIYFFDKWLENTMVIKPFKLEYWKWFFISLLFTCSALLLKPYAIFFILPMIVLSYKRWGIGFIKKWQIYFFMILAVLPLILWREWITQYPEGIPANNWLLNGDGIRFRPAFFRWILFERLTKLISGYFGISILLFGLYRFIKIKEWLFFGSFLVSSALYVVIFATGNVKHDYYQILIMPSIAICFAIGTYFLSSWFLYKIPIGKIILGISLISLFWFGWYQIRDYFNINNPSLVVAGNVVDKLTPKDAKVIALYDGDTSFLYQTKRKGWASFEKILPEMIKLGADYLVMVNPKKEDYGFSTDYKLISKSSQYILFNLHQKP